MYVNDFHIERSSDGVIRVGDGVFSEINTLIGPDCGGVILIADARVHGIWLSEIEWVLRPLSPRLAEFLVDPGEASKSLQSYSDIVDRVLSMGIDRSWVVVGLGGGVATDLAGFVGATLLRGLGTILVPTSLLAMVDAAIGGKNGVDSFAGKNLIGTFSWPMAVLADLRFLRTLPALEMRHGAVEMLKHGVVGSVGLFKRLLEEIPNLATGFGPAADTIGMAVDVKVDVVARDPFETGERRTLNFGHTIGHAIETASGYSVPHGAAVGVGMVIESMIAERAVGLAPDVSQQIREAVMGLKIVWPTGIDFGVVKPLLYRDKKNIGGHLSFALPTDLGVMFRGNGDYVTKVPVGMIEECFNGWR